MEPEGDFRMSATIPNLIKNNASSDMVAIMQPHSCVSYLNIPPTNRLFALFHSISKTSTHLFYLSLHHETFTTVFPSLGIDIRRHRPSSLLCSTHWRRISTQPSRLGSRFHVIARSARKPSYNDNVVASPWFKHCPLGWFRHEFALHFTRFFFSRPWKNSTL